MAQWVINAGRGWTHLATECYLTSKCSKKCFYYKYCKVAAKEKGFFVLKVVVKMLVEQFGPPPTFLIRKAKASILEKKQK